jgi:hypothetical protein
MIEQISGAAAASTQSVASKPASPKTEAPKVAAVVDTQPISPRLRFDAVSGVVVTEFLNGKSVTAQTPSAAALAYMRMGLTADGMPEPDVGDEHPPVEA